MSRDYASLNVDIWADPDWRKLPPAAQHVYLALWTSPILSYCGVHDWRPGRLTGLSAGFTADHIRTVAACLQARHFLVVDEETEEVLIRSWIRFDGLLNKPRMAVAMVKAYSVVASATLRSVVVGELVKIKSAHPEFSCWNDDRVSILTSHEALDAKSLPVPSDPFAPELATGQNERLRLGLPQTLPTACPPPTPSPTPAPLLLKDTAPRKRGARIPDDFAVTDEMRQWATEKGFDSLDLDGLTEEFFNYWSALAGSKATKLDWVKTWKNRVMEVAGRAGVRSLRAAPTPTSAPDLVGSWAAPDAAEHARLRGF